MILIILESYFLVSDFHKLRNFINASDLNIFTCVHEVGHYISVKDKSDFNFITIKKGKTYLGLTGVKLHSDTLSDRMYLAGAMSEYLFSEKASFGFNIDSLRKFYKFDTEEETRDEFMVSFKNDESKINPYLTYLYGEMSLKQKDILYYSMIVFDEKIIKNERYFYFLKKRLEFNIGILKFLGILKIINL